MGDPKVYLHGRPGVEEEVVCRGSGGGGSDGVTSQESLGAEDSFIDSTGVYITRGNLSDWKHPHEFDLLPSRY